MQFYDGTNKNGLCQEVDRLCDTTDTSYSRLDKTSRINQSQEQVVGDIIAADGTWEFDDTNYTDLPRGTGTLVEGQENYSFSSEYLQITEIEILDTNGTFYKLKALDKSELGEQSPQEVFGTTSGSPSKGRPEYYDILGDTIFLYPAPSSVNVTLTSGLRVWFKRKPQAFTATSATTDDTTEPGLPSSYHVILAYMAAIPYCMAYHPERVKYYQAEIARLRAAIITFYTLRWKDKPKQITIKPIRFR